MESTNQWRCRSVFIIAWRYNITFGSHRRRKCKKMFFELMCALHYDMLWERRYNWKLMFIEIWRQWRGRLKYNIITELPSASQSDAPSYLVFDIKNACNLKLQSQVLTSNDSLHFSARAIKDLFRYRDAPCNDYHMVCI